MPSTYAHYRLGLEVKNNLGAAEKKVVEEYPDNKAYLSYVYGFICHFILDATCHGYIDEKIESSGISHTEIEVEFDRMLMVKDGYDPIRHRLTEHIVPSMGNAEVIQAFFEGAETRKGQLYH